MATKRMKELRNLTKDEMVTKVRETEAELFQAKMKLVTGQLGNTAQIWRLRKDIARIKTLQSQAATAPQKAAKGAKKAETKAAAAKAAR